jgi:hypothetical protein
MYTPDSKQNILSVIKWRTKKYIPLFVMIWWNIIITRLDHSPLTESYQIPGIKQTPWPVVRKRTIPTKRPPLVGEVSANFCG